MRIVRKRSKYGEVVAFWIDAHGDLCGWGEGEKTATVDFEVATDGGWIADEGVAESCGTTLSALHQELTEGGEGANDSQV